MLDELWKAFAEEFMTSSTKVSGCWGLCVGTRDCAYKSFNLRRLFRGLRFCAAA